MKSLSRIAAAMVAPMLITTAAYAQEFPVKTVRFIVPSGPGLITDIVARSIVQNISERTGWTIIVENKPGGNYAVGMQAMQSAPADGHTVFMGVSSMTLLPTTHPAMNIDWLEDMERVTKLVSLQNALFTHTGVPFKKFEDFTAHAKANPDELSFGSIGVGSVTQLAGQQLQLTLDIDIRNIPYRDTTLVTDVMAGTTDLGIIPPFNIAPQIADGKLVPLAVLGSERSPLLPDVPSTQELGYPEITADGWLGLVVKKGTPEHAKKVLHAEFVKALRDPALKARLGEMGLITIGDTAEAFDKSFRDDVAHWAQLIPKLQAVDEGRK